MDITKPVAAFLRNMAPMEAEVDAGDLAVTGKVPMALAGMLLRNGPNPQFATSQAHWFAGDGMLHAFYFENGKVSYRNRWVRTQRWRAERADGHSTPSPRDSHDGVANTNIICHAGQLLALEEGHLPVRLDGPGLGTLGATDAGGALSGPFTAHPKLNPATGELVFFGYATPEVLGAGMVYGTLDAAGRVTRNERFVAPYASMVHDFAITQRYAIFPVMPLVGDARRAATGGPAYAWEPERNTQIGLLRRDAAIETVQWWEKPACYVYHVMNAWDEGDQVFMDVMQSSAPALFTLADGTKPKSGGACLCRWTFDTASAERCVSEEWLCDIPGEFPRIDERLAGTMHRHGWFVGDHTHAGPFGRIVHIDHEDGRIDTFELPDTDCASEAVFVPHCAAAVEGEGWLLAVAFRGAAQTSDLLIFDAQKVSSGPVATVHLPHRIPNGFHGNWFGAGTPIASVVGED